MFPATTHTRFEHSIGVVRQVQALIDGIETNSASAGRPVIGGYRTYLLRLAALLHDCGHAVMSHVSEDLIKETPGISDLVNWTHHAYRTRKRPSPSEAIAAVFVESPAFRELLSLPRAGAAFIRNVEEACHQIAHLILGGPGERGFEYLSLLLNGAFDADKLDYMPRDCLFAGVPSGVDVSRVVEKVQVLSVGRDMLSTKYVEWADAAERENITVLSLSTSGKGVLAELAATRTVLFQKVYHHQKVRAIEVMVRRHLQNRVNAGTLSSVTDWLKLTDHDVLEPPDPIAGFFRERYLLKRAFFFHAPDEDQAVETTAGKFIKAGSGWRRVRNDVRNGRLRSAITEESRKIANILNVGVAALDQLEPEVDLPDVTRYSLDQFAFIGDGVTDFELADPVLERSENTLRLTTAHGHVFAPESAVLPTFLATRHVLLRDYGQRYEAGSYASTKLDPDDVICAETTLTAAGYGAELAQPIATRRSRMREHREIALEEFLKASWPRIEQLGIDFGVYQSLDGDRVSATAVADFLRQFGTEDLARPALRLLESIKILDRNFFTERLGESISDAALSTAVEMVVPLGSTSDSSTLLMYVMGDLPEHLRRAVRPLELALEQGGKGQLLLWDDFCASGSHTIGVLQQWLGLPCSASEYLADRLTEARRARFFEQQITIGFAVAMPRGIAAVREFLAQQGLNNVAVLEPRQLLPDRDDALDTDEVIADTHDREQLTRFLKQKAESILAEKVKRTDRAWSESQLSERLLGYGNAAQRIVFFYNVPTATITALWVWSSDGEWRPLFRRRTKPPRDNARS